MSVKFVVSHLDQQLGPFDEAELKSKWAKGELLPIDYVYDESKTDWILLAERFEWAGGKPENGSPPPLRPDLIKKRRPPEPPAASATRVPATTAINIPVEIRGNSLLKEWKKPAGQGAKVKIVDGVGEIDLSSVQPGQVELVLQDASNSILKMQEPLKIQVKAADPVEMIWTIPTSQVVGHDLEIILKAMDANNNICTHYEDSFTLKINGLQDTLIVVRSGAGTARFTHTKAEAWKISIHHSGNRQLKLPETQTLEWQPGAAVQLVLDGPQNLVAGMSLKVQVRALDAYGNLAKTFQGTVILEVKAS